MTETEPKPLEFPLSFTKCPACGCLDTVGAVATKEEQAAGKLPKDMRLMATTATMPLRDLRRALPGLPVPVVYLHFDVCVQCGTLYLVLAEKKSVSLQHPMGPGRQAPL